MVLREENWRTEIILRQEKKRGEKFSIYAWEFSQEQAAKNVSTRHRQRGSGTQP